MRLANEGIGPTNYDGHGIAIRAAARIAVRIVIPDRLLLHGA